MPTDSAPTRQAVLESAKREFLLHGYSGASLRAIAANAGVTTGALYRHYRDKAALFEALVEPVRSEVVKRFTRQTDEYVRSLETRGMEPMWNREGWNTDAFVEFIYDHLDEFKLLLSGAAPPLPEDFAHTLIELEIRSTLLYLTEAKRQGHPIRIPADQELHMIANAQFSTYFELVLHDIPRDEGLRYAATMTRFFVAGWKEIILG